MYVALAKMPARAWTEGTCPFGDTCELIVRRWLGGERGELIGAHVALYFEDATDEMLELNRPLVVGDRESRSFFVDCLDDGTFAVHSPGTGWYGKWERLDIELHRVIGVDDPFIERVHAKAVRIATASPEYDCFLNVNSVLRCWPWTCGCVEGGVTCISAVVVALAAGVDPLADEERAAQALGLTRRAHSGAYLPSELIRELTRAGVIQLERTEELREGAETEAALPLLAVR